MNSRWLIAAGGGLLVAALVLPAARWRSDATSSGDGAETAGAEVCDGRAAPASFDFTLTDMNGQPVDLAQYRGKVVLLNFWATWCGPCKYEIPIFVELQDQYREQGFVALGVSTDDPPDKLQAFAAEYNMNYPVLVGRDHEEIQDAYGPIWGIPVSFFIGRDGTICRREMGLRPKEHFEQIIKSLL